MNNVHSVFVTGATGFIGSALIKRLYSEQIKIITLVRKNSNTTLIDQLGIQKVVGDVTDIHSFINNIKNIDVIFNLAGVVTDWAPKELYEAVHIIGTRNIFEAAAKNNVKRVVQMSTSEVLRKDNFDCNLNDKDGIGNPKDIYTKTKIEGEKIGMHYHKIKKVEAVFIRPTWVYGPGDTTLIPEIIYQLKNGFMVYIKNLKNYIPLIYVDNLVDFLLKASYMPNISGEGFLISDQEKITWYELSEYLVNRLGGRNRKICIPYKLAVNLANILEFFSKNTHKKNRPILTKTAVEMLSANISVDITHAINKLNYNQKISLIEGLDKTIEWIKHNNLDNLRKK